MKKKKISKKTIFIFEIAVFLLLLSNFVWFKLYMKEKNNLRHSLMPVSQGDYYQEQLSLVNNYKLLQLTSEYESEFKEDEYQDKKEVPYIEQNPDYPRDVPFIKQNPDYPNGCEAVSATMLLKSYGIDITVDEFVNKYLKKDVIYSRDGNRYGPNPKYIYAGDPTSETMGFGVFEPGIKLAIEKVLYDKIKNGINYNVYGSENKEALECLVHNNNLPIVIWATIDYDPVSEMWTWRSYDDKYTYTYPKNSHTIVVTGVDEEYYYVNDPLKDKENIKVEKKKLEDSFDSMGRQAVRIDMYDIHN